MGDEHDAVVLMRAFQELCIQARRPAERSDKALERGLLILRRVPSVFRCVSGTWPLCLRSVYRLGLRAYLLMERSIRS